MNKYLKTFLGLFIILIPAALTMGIFFNKLTKKSFYENSGEVKISGLKSGVKIYSDEYGVPHIFAKDNEDLYFALGYMHAQDRLWQMDIARRAAEGKLSQILGNSVIDYDKLFRTIGIDKFSYRLYDNISQRSREILQSYANGVNKFIELHQNKLPAEFDILNYKPELWRPEHSLMIGRLMAWDLNLSWYSDYIFKEIVDKTGIEKASEIFPDTTIILYKKPKTEIDTVFSVKPNIIKPTIIEGKVENDTMAILPRKKKVKQKETDQFKEEINPEETPAKKDTGNGAGYFFEIYNSYRNFFGLSSNNSGSNSWIVSGEKSENGKPLLADDPHLNFQAPSKWYEVHLKDGSVDVTGMSIPGIPAVIIGHNRVICWGLTNLMNDDNDFVLLSRDYMDSSKYVYENQKFALDSTVEKIEVKNSDDVYYTVYNTKVGPVISGIKKTGQENFTDGSILTFRWTGYEYSDELDCFYKMSIARDWSDFKSALREFGAPAQNFMYADTAGSIGYHAGGKVPLRKTGANDYVNFSGDNQWLGFVDFDKLPNEYNPKDGYIVTANTNPFEWLQTDQNQRYYISWAWEPPSRFDKIKEVLQKKKLFDADEFKLLQMNYQSLYAKEISKNLIDAYKDYSEGNQEIEDALNRMKNWNGELKADASEGAIYSVFLIHLIKNIFFDELGEKIFYDFLQVTNLPLRTLMKLLSNKEESSIQWFDNINTSETETKDEIIRKSFSEGISFLRFRFSNPDIDSWRWGEIHQVKFLHPMGVAGALDKTFNIGPFEIGGDQTTVNNSEYSFVNAARNGTFENDLGPSMRMITDLSDITHSLSINSTGQSGQPLHTDYQDQSRLWLYGDYKENVMDEGEILDKDYKLLQLIP